MILKKTNWRNMNKICLSACTPTKNPVAHLYARSLAPLFFSWKFVDVNLCRKILYTEEWLDNDNNDNNDDDNGTCNIHKFRHQRTMVWNKQESRRKYWATRSSIRSFARTAHSFACSGLLASLAPSAALTHSLTRSLRSLPRSWESEFLMSQNDLVLSHSALSKSTACHR